MSSRWIRLLPCTMSELAASLGITLHQANGRLDGAKKRGRVKRTDRSLPSTTRGPKPHLWVEVKR
jgi:hypothetical protein